MHRDDWAQSVVSCLHQEEVLHEERECTDNTKAARQHVQQTSALWSWTGRTKHALRTDLLPDLTRIVNTAPRCYLQHLMQTGLAKLGCGTGASQLDTNQTRQWNAGSRSKQGPIESATQKTTATRRRGAAGGPEPSGQPGRRSSCGPRSARGIKEGLFIVIVIG